MSAYQATGDKSEYEVALGLLLRAERERQGLSLAGVEEKSRGRWKAVVVGTWERAERSITVAKLADMAAFYGVPVSALLPDCGDEAARALALAVRLAGVLGMGVDDLLRGAA